jgi:O-acetylhomoserine (thiol)-lyase
MNEWGFETKAIHSGLIPSQHQGATAVPIYETTSYAYDYC